MMMRCRLLLMLLMAAGAEAASVVAFGIPMFSASFGLRRVTEEECLYFHDDVLGNAPFPPGTAAAIHLGNTKSCIAIPSPSHSLGVGVGSSYHQFCIPSWVAVSNKSAVILTGEAARDHAARLSSPGTAAVSGFMRLLNRRPEDMVVKKLESEYNFTEQLGWASIQFQSQSQPQPQLEEEGMTMVFSPHHLAGILMSELKRMAEAHLGREIENAVITVPRHLTHDGRQSLRFAASREQAGFKATRVVDQQIAAAAAHGHHTKEGDGKVVLVFHVGGRTSHATIFKFVDGIARLIQARDDFFLGGDDFTARIVDYFVEVIKRKHGIDVRQDDNRDALLRLTAECERAKKALSDDQEEETVLVQLPKVGGLLSNFSAPLTRAKLEELNADLFHKAIGLVDSVVMQAPVVEESKGTFRDLLDAAMETVSRVVTGRSPAAESRKGLIDEIVLVGGSTRIPKIRQLVKDYFRHGRRELLVLPNDNNNNKRSGDGGGMEPDEAAIRGALLLTRPEAAGYLEECYWGPRLPFSRPWPCLDRELCGTLHT